MKAFVDYAYLPILDEVLNKGKEKKDRTGTGTLSIFGKQFRHVMGAGFPLLSTKKMPFKTIQTELKWFLKGDTNIKYLVDNGCNIWNGDAYKQYQRACAYELEREELTYKEFVDKIKTDDDFAHVWGDLGPIYGKQWRDWNGRDQIKDLIEEIKVNPNSRRLMVSAWNVGELDTMALPPCHHGFQVYIDGEYMSLMWNQRSVDTFLGLPFNIASYGLLLELLAYETGYKAGELIGNLGDVHLYKNHIEQAKIQVDRLPTFASNLAVNSSDILNGEFDVRLWFYSYHPKLEAPLSN